MKSRRIGWTSTVVNRMKIYERNFQSFPWVSSKIAHYIRFGLQWSRGCGQTQLLCGDIAFSVNCEVRTDPEIGGLKWIWVNLGSFPFLLSHCHFHLFFFSVVSHLCPWITNYLTGRVHIPYLYDTYSHTEWFYSKQSLLVTSRAERRDLEFMVLK